jgi:hypothetical protein
MVLLLRLTGYLGEADRGRLAQLERVLPGRLRPAFARLVRFLTSGEAPPAAAPAPQA